MRHVSFKNRANDVFEATPGNMRPGIGCSSFSPATENGIFVIEGAGHYDMYYKPDYVGQAVERLVPFYQKHLRI